HTRCYRDWSSDVCSSDLSALCLKVLSYSETFKNHLANPRNAGELPDANAVAEETNPVCGDRMRLSLRLRDGRIEAARFLAYGCQIGRASCREGEKVRGGA